MKIIRFGELVFREGQGPIIQGWQIEREPDVDPAEATDEQMLLAFVIMWAKPKFEAATNRAAALGLHQAVLRIREQKAAKDKSVKYVVRLNPGAFNPITQHVNMKALVWEIEQRATRDSEKVIWHGGEVSINGTPIRQFFKVPKPGEKPWQFECSGVCVRGQDNTLEIHTRPSDASGN